MVDFKWKKNGNLTPKAKAYLSLTYKNQHSKGKFADNKEKADKLISKSRKRKKRTILKEIRKKRTIQKKVTKPQYKTRKQAVINYRSNKNEPYYISLRVLTTNPQYNKKALIIALRKLKKQVDNNTYHLEKKNKTVEINLDNFYREKYIGLEKEKIPYSQDRILNDNKIHYEVLIGRNDPKTGIIN